MRQRWITLGEIVGKQHGVSVYDAAAADGQLVRAVALDDTDRRIEDGVTFLWTIDATDNFEVRADGARGAVFAQAQVPAGLGITTSVRVHAEQGGDTRGRFHYLLAFLAKEIALRTHGVPGSKAVLDSLVEILAHAERNLQAAVRDS